MIIVETALDVARSPRTRSASMGLFRSSLVRLLQSVVVVWAAVSLLFAIFFVLPGDRVDQIFGVDRAVSPDARAALVEKLALDRPITEQYLSFWSDLARGDLGSSYVTDRSVGEIISDAAPASLRLAFWALVVEVILGVGIGVFVVARRSKLLDGASALMNILMIAMPVFVIGFLLQLGLGVHPFQNDWPEVLRFPVQGIGADTWWALLVPSGGQWRNLALPALTLGVASGVIAYRVTGESMRTAMGSSFVAAARARGVPERTILIRHGLRNALAPILAFVAIDLGALFGSAVVTESVFNWPGIGFEMSQALVRGDVPVILGITIVLAVVYVVIGIVVDIAQWLIDPRSRTR